ncbi:MAG TPA: hypothetical protein DDZ41_06365, partial [Flavobacterium sp.]|nr:hypothetical protein [Flavobacterium sp.]
MTNKLFLVFFLLITTIVSAQEGTSSPYSFYGLGDEKFKGTHDVRAMGGLSVVNDSIHVNLLNPATFSKIKITNFVIGGSTMFSNLANETKSEKAQRTSLDYLAVAFPIGKFGTNFGIMPFTSVGYRVQNETTEGDIKKTTYNGSGGINRVFFGLGYNLIKDFSIGANLQYNFGTIESKTIVFIPNVTLGSREINESMVKGISTNFALLYNKKLAKKYTLSTTFNYTPQAKLTNTSSREIATITINSAGNEVVSNSIKPAVSNTKLIIPAKYTFATGIGISKKWFVGAEYSYIENSNLQNRFTDFDKATFEDSHKFVLGGYYIPKFSSLTSYWSRVNYRAGFRYQ